MPWSKLLLHEFDSVLLVRACFCVNLHEKPVIIGVPHCDQTQSLLSLTSTSAGPSWSPGPPGPPGPSGGGYEFGLMETSTGLTSLAHQLLSDPRIMKLMLLWNLSTTRLRPFLLQKALGRTQLAHAETWDSATQNGAVVGWDIQLEWPFSQVRPFKAISHWYERVFESKWHYVKSYSVNKVFSFSNQHPFSRLYWFVFLPFHGNTYPAFDFHGEERKNCLILKIVTLFLLM